MISNLFIESNLQNLLETKTEFSDARANSLITKLLQTYKIEKDGEINALLETLIKAAKDSADVK